MKYRPTQIMPSMVAPPGETPRDSVAERRSAAHRNDPVQHWQDQLREHDNRSQLAAGGAWQRLRARQMEPRTAEQCHLRIRRRAPGQN